MALATTTVVMIVVGRSIDRCVEHDTWITEFLGR